MQFITENECKTWCKNHGIVLSADLTARYGVDGEQAFSIFYETKQSSSVIALLNHVATLSLGEQFHGGLLWLKTWGVWNELCEQTAQTLMKQLRLANNESSPLSERPGTLFGSDEINKLQSFLTIPMLFGWDAYFFPDSQDYFLFISHDSWIDVHCKTKERFELEFNAAFYWEPKVL